VTVRFDFVRFSDRSSTLVIARSLFLVIFGIVSILNVVERETNRPKFLSFSREWSPRLIGIAGGLDL
jgi:hypothetical protein